MLQNSSFVILMLKMCIVLGQKKVVVIDSGHGGKDSGAIGINGIQEKDVVLKVAKEILRLNKSLLDSKYDIYLTRYGDTLISLPDRSLLAKSLNADVFVSLHCNHSDNPNARGIEVYVSKNRTDYTKKSIWVAFKLQAEIKDKLGFESRGVKSANFQVLRDTGYNCVSVLLELGFLSNEDESRYLSENIKTLAYYIHSSLK